jgi:signal peptidase I
MMEQSLVAKRNGVGLFFVGLLLGPVASMLWLGRGKYAALYLLATILLLFAFFALPVLGFTNPIKIPNLNGGEVFGLAGYPLAVLGIFHAFRANKTGSLRPFYSHWYIALLVPIALTLSIAFLVRTFLFQPFNIPSASSIPNYVVGDYVFVSKTAYTNSNPPRVGDTAVFKLPSDPTIDYIKRIVGGPGDKIQMIDGILNINGSPTKLVEVNLPDFLMGDDGEKKFYRETLPNGRSYVIADLGKTEADNTDIYIVPEGHYFTMGDNRDNTMDSRFLDRVGYIPRENFIGPVVFRFWNDQGLPLIDRPPELSSEP